MSTNDKRKSRKPWPVDCVWPEPLHEGSGMQWEVDFVDESALDERGQNLMEIKEYFDSLVEEGRLNEDYSLNEYYADTSAGLTDLADGEESGFADWTDLADGEEAGSADWTNLADDMPASAGMADKGTIQVPVLSDLTDLGELDVPVSEGRTDQGTIQVPVSVFAGLDNQREAEELVVSDVMANLGEDQDITSVCMIDKFRAEVPVLSGLTEMGEVEVPVYAGLADTDDYEEPVTDNLSGIVKEEEPVFPNVFGFGEDEKAESAGLTDQGSGEEPLFANLFGLGGDEESVAAGLSDQSENEEPVFADLFDSSEDEAALASDVTELGKDEEPVLVDLADLGEDEESVPTDLTDLADLAESEESVPSDLTDQSAEEEPVFADLFDSSEDEAAVASEVTELGKDEEPLLSDLAELSTEGELVSDGLSDVGENEEPVFTGLADLTEIEDPVPAGLADVSADEVSVFVDLTGLDEGEKSVAAGLTGLDEGKKSVVSGLTGLDEAETSVSAGLADLSKDETSVAVGLDDPGDEEVNKFVPELGEEYWDNGFLIDEWEGDLSEHMNQLKIDVSGVDVIMDIYHIIGYRFINENLLRQAFTRRDFAVEYGLSGCNEELEFLGDSVLNTVVTREIVKHMAKNNTFTTEAPFDTKYNEGDFTRIRSGFVSKEHLAGRTVALGLDKYILYGTNEEPSESSREDALEALVGAVTIDSDWNQSAIETVIDRLLNMQLGDPDIYLKKTYYEIFNSWHQSHFGQIPSYEVHPAPHESFDCTMRYFIPENNKDVLTDQRIDVNESTRSRARERAAEMAYHFVVKNGLWMNLRNAELVPDLEHSINQLQELFQKKYIDEQPVYEFEELSIGGWECRCICGGVYGHGMAGSKAKAKKKASYMMLIHLLDSAGICKKEWLDTMYRSMLDEN